MIFNISVQFLWLSLNWLQHKHYVAVPFYDTVRVCYKVESALSYARKCNQHSVRSCRLNIMFVEIRIYQTCSDVE